MYNLYITLTYQIPDDQDTTIVGTVGGVGLILDEARSAPDDISYEIEEADDFG